MAIPDPPKAGSPFSPLWTGVGTPKPRKLTTFLFPKLLSGGVIGTGSLMIYVSRRVTEAALGPPGSATVRESVVSLCKAADS